MPLLARRAVVRQSDPLGSPSGTAPVNWAVLAEPVASESCMGEIPDLFFFKALTREFQCPAVLRDRANDVIRGSRRHLGCYFEGHRDLSSHQAGKMRDHLVSASLLDQTGHVDRCLLVPSGYCLAHIFSNVVNLDVRLAHLQTGTQRIVSVARTRDVFCDLPDLPEEPKVDMPLPLAILVLIKLTFFPSDTLAVPSFETA